MATTAEIQTAYKALYRADLNATVAAAIANTGITVQQYVTQELPKVAATTQAVVAITAFITGVTPTADKLDALKIDADKQFAFYTSIGATIPALGAYEAFGRALSVDSTTTAGFNTKYGALSTTDFINTVYTQVFGTVPTPAALASLTGQINYFTKLYTDSNIPNAALQAKGAVLGQIVGYAFVSDASANSTLDNQVAAFFQAAATGSTSGFAAALPPVAGSGNTGSILTLTGGADVVDPSSTTLSLKSTAGDDVIRALTATALTSADVVNGGGGTDTLNANFVQIAAGTTIAPVLTSVERVFLAGTDTTTVFTGAASTGLQQVWGDSSALTVAGDSALTVAGVNTDVTIGVKGTATTKRCHRELHERCRHERHGQLRRQRHRRGSSITAVGVENAKYSVLANSNITHFSSNTLKTAVIATDSSVTGNTNLTFTSASTALESVDASGLRGGLTLTDPSVTKDFNVKGGTGNDVITLTAATNQKMTVDGGAGNDIITTGVNNDTIIGGDGNDVIRGNAGADTVTVGAGNDVVQFAALTDSVANNNGFDTITDFKAAGTDVIQFVGLGVASLVNAPSQILGQNAVDALAATATVTQAATAYFGGARLLPTRLASSLSRATPTWWPTTALPRSRPRPTCW